MLLLYRKLLSVTKPEIISQTNSTANVESSIHGHKN